MGRNLVGGTAVATTTSTSSSSSTGDLPKGSFLDPYVREEGLPLLCVGGTANTSFNAGGFLGLEVINSFGEPLTSQSYMAAHGGGDYSWQDTYSSQYPYGQGSGYASGNQYGSNMFYSQQNPSTTNYHTSFNNAGNCWYWTGQSNTGKKWWQCDLNMENGTVSYKFHGHQTTYGGVTSNQLGAAGWEHTGSWIGPEGTRQNHSIVSQYNSLNLMIFRDQRKNLKWNETRIHKAGALDDQRDNVDWWEFAPQSYKDALAKTAAAHLYPCGSRWSYNENRNELITVTGYSTYSSQSYVLRWTGATGKNLYDTSLYDWLTAATAENLGLISTGFANMSGDGGYMARSWLTNSGRIIVSWKNSSNNYCYWLNTGDNDSGAVVGTSMNVGGSTTSYSYDQGTMVHTHDGLISWDNKWIMLGWVYYYYHCGFMCVMASLDDPACYATFSDTNSSHYNFWAQYGKSGFYNGTSSSHSGYYGYARVYNLDETYQRYTESTAALTQRPFHYKMRAQNYVSGTSAYSTGAYERINNPHDFDVANGMVWRTNINVNGAIDQSQSTWQQPYYHKSEWFVPTNYSGVMNMDRYHNKLYGGKDNSKDLY